MNHHGRPSSTSYAMSSARIRPANARDNVNNATSVATVATPPLELLNSSLTVSLRVAESVNVAAMNSVTSTSTSFAAEVPRTDSNELSALTRASTAAGTERIVQNVIAAATSPIPSVLYSWAMSLASCHNQRTSDTGRRGGLGERMSWSIGIVTEGRGSFDEVVLLNCFDAGQTG